MNFATINATMSLYIINQNVIKVHPPQGAKTAQRSNVPLAHVHGNTTIVQITHHITYTLIKGGNADQLYIIMP